jgi:phospholipid-binding lipoprotein MlaA
VVVDIYSSPPTYLDDVAWRNSLYALSLVDGRSGLIQAEQLLSGDRYLFVRDAYLQQRDAFVNDGVVEDNFSNFDEDEEWGDEF